MDMPKINVEGGKRRASKPGLLGVSALVVLSAASEGVSRVHQRLVERMYRKGETKDSLIRTLDEYPLPGGVRKLVTSYVETSNGVEPPSIEVESIVEDVE